MKSILYNITNYAIKSIIRKVYDEYTVTQKLLSKKRYFII